MNLRAPLALLLAGLCAWPLAAQATFSIVACDKDGSCGVAVATNNLAVGASVGYAQARVGALVSQFETNPNYGPKGLALLAAGSSPQETIAKLLAADGHFDGSGTEARQVGIVDARGRSATYTGAEAAASAWAGARHGERYAAQGNGLAGENVVASIEKTFQSAGGDLAERLMAALEAGQAAGGQTIGKLSAALLVRTPEGAWQDIDLRVDAAADPIGDLHRLLDRRYAWQAMIRAERLAGKGDVAQARTAMADALHRSAQWDRIWRRAARLAMQMGDTDRALDYLGVFAAINPVWARMEFEDALYAPLEKNTLFASWKAAAKAGR